MKHDAKGVWRHRPDELPIEDGPSMGARKKKRALECLPKKHLWDKLAYANKKLLINSARLIQQGIPTVHRTGPGWASMDCWFGEMACEALIKSAEEMGEFIQELERRMK